MRLYISSFRLGNQPQKLVELVADKMQALVIANACDLSIPRVRRKRLERELTALRGLGFQAEELDLRDYFAKDREGPRLRARLEPHGLIWVRGGNPFVLRRAMRQSGFDTALRDLLHKDALVYGGYSGGIAVMGPTLHGVELVSDPKTVPTGYDPDIIWEGLGLLDYSLAPHYRCNHPASPAIEGVVDYLVAHRIPHRTLRDGEAILMTDAGETFLS